MKACYHYLFSSLVCLILLLPCPVSGQAQQRKLLTEADYQKFGKLSLHELSADGRWVSFGMAYENGADTLFLQDTSSKEIVAFPQGKQGRFGGAQLFAYKSQDTLVVKHLKTTQTERLANIKRFDFATGGKCLITLDNGANWQLRNLNGSVMASLDGVTDYVPSEALDAVAVTREAAGQHELLLFYLNPYRKEVIAKSTMAFTKVCWQKENTGFCYFNGTELHYYNLRQRRNFTLPASTLMAIKKQFAETGRYPVVMSPDGKKIFFSVNPIPLKDPKGTQNTIEVWNGNDAVLYPTQNDRAMYDTPLLCVWLTEKGTLKILNDESHYMPRLSGMQDYVVNTDPFRYGLEPKYVEDTDLLIRNVATGAEKMLFEKQSNNSNFLCFSPYSNSMIVYRDAQWWHYNPATDAMVCLTQSANVKWDNADPNPPHQYGVYGLGAWVKGNRYLLLYDKWDIWKVALDGSSCQRLTKGREQNTVYRIDKSEFRSIKRYGYQGETRNVIDLKKDIVLYAENQNDWSTGYAAYSTSKGIKPLDYQPALLSRLIPSRNGQYVYSRETYAQPPQLFYKRALELPPQLLYTSNRIGQQFAERKAELVRYTNKNGNLLKAALFYPDGYDARKQYPMVTIVYDQKSHEIHRHDTATLLNDSGCAAAYYTANGYFALYPDIAYALGDTGLSATECVVAAVHAALATASIDRNKIGLAGHSFGGYETDFIITQTDLFAAAVSGAGINDIISRYFGLYSDFIHKDEMWRYETQQWRMGGSFFAIKEKYWNNSPLPHADAITTPLLLWAGKNDIIVPFEQSVAFYMALRRLRLPTVLLGYPNESHSLRKDSNQIHLTRKITDWFDYYLKDKKDVGWIQTGTTYE